MLGRLAAAAFLLGVLSGGRAGAGDWRTYAGSARRLFLNPAERTITAANVDRLRVKWTFQTGAVVTASPSVAELDIPGEGRVQVAFVQSWDHYLYAIRTRDGTELWRFFMEDQPGATFPNPGSVDVRPIGGAERVFVAGGETTYSVDALTGREVWHFRAGTGCGEGNPPGLCGFKGERNAVESSPIVADGKVFFGMDVNDDEVGKGGVFAVDVRDGRLLWFFDLESGATCRPLPGDNIRRFDGYHSEAELGLPPGFLATRPGCAFDRTTTGCGNVWSSAAVDERRGLLYFVSSNCDTDTNPTTPKPPPPMPPYDEAIVALHLDGTAAWRWRPREVDNDDLAFGAVPNLFTIERGGAAREVVGVGGKDGTYYVIDRDGVNEVTGVRWNDPDPSALPYWRTQVVPGGEIGGIIATAAVDEAAHRIYFSTAPGLDIATPQRPTVHALHRDTGAIVWQNTAETNADASFSPTSAIPGVVFAGKTIGGVLRAYDAATGMLLGSVPLSFTLASAPAVVDGLVIIGAASGARSFDRFSDGDVAARIPSPVTALCVPGTPACDGDRDGFDFPDECDDRDSATFPGALERCDGRDNDCDGAIPPDELDADGDGWRICAGDCDDADPKRNPAATDLPDNDVDENCDGRLALSTDSCGEGGSGPQDGRDIAAVRAAAERACPCASFDGSPGRTHGAYTRCRRLLVLDALATGRLRAACAGEVQREFRDSTWGRPEHVVCCEPNRRGRSRCRIRAARECVRHGRKARANCSPATHCADTRCEAAGVCTGR